MPIWGRAMTVAGFVKIDRKDPESARAALAEAGATMQRRGISAGDFTRRHPQFRRRRAPVQAWRPSSLQRATGLPILPVAIDGTRHDLPKGADRVRLGQVVNVSVLEPLVSPNFEDFEALRESVRARIAGALVQS